MNNELVVPLTSCYRLPVNCHYVDSVQWCPIVEQLVQRAREYHIHNINQLCWQHGRPNSVVIITPNATSHQGGGCSFFRSSKGIYHIIPGNYQLSKKLVSTLIVQGDFGCDNSKKWKIFPSTYSMALTAMIENHHHSSNISNARKKVSSDFYTPRSGLRKRGEESKRGNRNVLTNLFLHSRLVPFKAFICVSYLLKRAVTLVEGEVLENVCPENKRCILQFR